MIYRIRLSLYVRYLAFTLCSLLPATVASGQVASARPDRGTMPNASYNVSDIENISLENGNVNLSIPLASLPPIAGGKLSWTIRAQYNSKVWDITRTQLDADDDEWSPYVVNNPQLSDRGNWRISTPYSIEIRPASWDFDYAMPPSGAIPYNEYYLLVNYNWYKVVLIMPDGAEHELRPVDYSPAADGTGLTFLHGYYNISPYTQSPMRYYSFDGSYLYATINSNANSWTVYLPDGTKVVQTTDGIQRIQDTNGNKIKIYYDANGTHYQDEQTGREIRFGTDNKVWYQTVGGAWQSVELVWGTTTVEGKLYKVNDWIPFQLSTKPCIHDAPLSAELQVIREIVLPSTEPGQPQRRFTFSYNSDTTESATNSVRWSCSSSFQSYTRQASKGWGSLSRMVTPSGAIIDYSYQLDSPNPMGHLPFNVDMIPAEPITQKKITHDGTNDIWTYSILNNTATVVGPDGGTIEERKYSHEPGYGFAFGKAGLVYRSTRPFTRIDRHWSDVIFSGAATTSPNGPVSFNAVMDAEYTTLLDGAGNQLKMSAKTFQYDFNGNVLQTTEYDWFDPTLVSRDNLGVPTGVPGGATVLRVTSTSYYNPATTSSSGNVYAKRSLSTATPLILNAVQQNTLGSAITQISYDGFAYGTAPTVGNVTSKRDWVDLDSKWITNSQTYDSYGNLLTKTDARGNVTEFYYDDTTYALPNRIVVNPQNGTGSQTLTTAYDYYTNLVTSQTDPNNNVSTIDYTNQLLGAADPFGRPGIMFGPLVNAGGTNQRQRVTTTYLDGARQVIVATDLNAENDKLLKSRTTSDMLGRSILKEQTEDGTNYTISARKVYEQMGKITYASNPARSAGALSDGWTRSTADTLGRVIEVAKFSGAAQPPSSGTNANWTGSVTTVYDGSKTTVTDQAGKVRRSEVNALGIVVNVVEDPSGLAYQTNYTYDIAGNLLTVVQGAQTRTFTYDSLYRMRTATNPESGTTIYNYDDNGNLLTKKDSRPVTTTLTYDAINRIASKTYSDGTPRADYFYDTQGLPGGAPTFDRGHAKGRLVAVTYGGGSAGSYRGYDAAGAVVRQIQQTDSVNYLAEASYSLAGRMASQTYPAVPSAGDRRVVSFSYDNAARLSGLTSAATSYAPAANVSSISYGPHGGLTSETYSNNLIHGVMYNSRLQPSEIKLGTSGAPTSVVSISYNYGTTNNNGNVQSISYAGGGLSYTQSFSYDQLNRLSDANENSGSNWSQTSGYDRYGNRWIDLGGGNQSLYFNPVNNRINSYSYDAAGNLLNDGSHSYTFDGENKIRTVDSVSAYVYDGEGQRVRKLLGENLRLIYGIGGQQIAEYDGATGNLKKEYIYGANGLVATIEPTSINSNGTRFTTSDHLGSPRLVTNSAAAVVSRHDYMPFGEELGSGVGGRTTPIGFVVADGLRQRFTSKERDNETGLDYFLARYYSAGHGRFISVDPVIMEKRRLADPQALNLYVYARNNPLRFIDPDGEKFKGIDNQEVIIKQEKVNGKKIWIIKSNNASADLRKLVDLINKSGSKSASSQFSALNKSVTMVTIVIDTTTSRTPAEIQRGGATIGLHQPHNQNGALTFDDTKDRFSGVADAAVDSNGKPIQAYREATITLYEKKMAEGGLSGAALEKEMVATFGHEVRHDTDPLQIQAGLSGTGSDAIWHPKDKVGNPAKKSPYWYSNKIKQEIDAARSKGGGP
jgi:RHS repeat-associated protein